MQSFYLKTTNNKKKLYFEENVAVNEKNPKYSGELNNSRYAFWMWEKIKKLLLKLKENGVVSLTLKDSKNLFCGFFQT